MTLDDGNWRAYSAALASGLSPMSESSPFRGTSFPLSKASGWESGPFPLVRRTAAPPLPPELPLYQLWHRRVSLSPTHLQLSAILWRPGVQVGVQESPDRPLRRPSSQGPSSTATAEAASP